jgi:hypothetical protein
VPHSFALEALLMVPLLTMPACLLCVPQGEMPSPPQRGARERELREARDQLREQNGESISSCLEYAWQQAATPARGSEVILWRCAAVPSAVAVVAKTGGFPTFPHHAAADYPCCLRTAIFLSLQNCNQNNHAAGDASEVLNERAMAVMRRMTDKLMGRDHILEGSSATAECDSVPAQVQRLIAQAISHENLCQSYIGWCPFVSDS